MAHQSVAKLISLKSKRTLFRFNCKFRLAEHYNIKHITIEDAIKKGEAIEEGDDDFGDFMKEWKEEHPNEVTAFLTILIFLLSGIHKSL
jgi:hypothetical protein